METLLRAGQLRLCHVAPSPGLRLARSLSTKGRDSGKTPPPHRQNRVGGRQPEESWFPREAQRPEDSPLWVYGW